MIVEFIFMVDKPTLNNRIYERREIEVAANDFVRKTDSAFVYSKLKEFQPNLDELVGKVKSVEIDDEGKIFAEIEMFQTPAANHVKALYDEDVKMVINPHMYGVYDPNSKKVENVEFRFMEIMWEM